jgi:hypothetical protein
MSPSDFFPIAFPLKPFLLPEFINLLVYTNTYSSEK